MKHLTNIIVASVLLLLSVMLIVHSYQGMHPRLSILPPDRSQPRSIEDELRFINDKQDHILGEVSVDSIRQVIPVAVEHYQQNLDVYSKNTAFLQEWPVIKNQAFSASKSGILPAGVYLNISHVYLSNTTTAPHIRLEMVLSQSTSHWFSLPLMDIASPAKPAL